MFVLVGLALEGLHGFKIGAYLDASNETRRSLWRLAHVHGALLSLVHIAFAVSLERIGEFGTAKRVLASRCLCDALVLMPTGGALGGAWIHGGDPMSIYKTMKDGVVAKGMPAWGPQLGEAKTQAVSAYVLSLRNTNVPGGKAPQGEKFAGR